MEIINRKRAIELGLTIYFTGKPCKNGHTCERFVANKTCKECLRLLSANRRENTQFIDDHKVYMDKYNRENRESILQNRRDKLSHDEEYRQKEKSRQASWAKENKKKALEIKARYRTSKANAPTIEGNKQLTKQFYLDCPRDKTVDHIIPISKGGAHDIGNLQYLSPSQNSSKKDGQNIAINGIYCISTWHILQRDNVF